MEPLNRKALERRILALLQQPLDRSVLDANEAAELDRLIAKIQARYRETSYDSTNGEEEAQ